MDARHIFIQFLNDNVPELHLLTVLHLMDNRVYFQSYIRSLLSERLFSFCMDSDSAISGIDSALFCHSNYTSSDSRQRR